MIRMMVAGIFAIAGLSKVINLSEFLKILSDSLNWPPVLTGFTALLLPGLEVAVGLSLIITSDSHFATALAWLLNVAFLIVAIYMWIVSPKVSCACMPGVIPDNLNAGVALMLRSLGFFSLNSFLVWNSIRFESFISNGLPLSHPVLPFSKGEFRDS